ncbi:MAG: peptide deformylase, peptide deformylase [Patescibacteria group bacterium]|nr:peptide deformylase, peptide deformylase [Patescibacteria group bacterium]
MCTIVQEPNLILRGKAHEIPVAEITKSAIRKVISDMKTALHREPDGVAIAAPQIAEPVRMFIVAGFVFDLKKKNITGTPTPDKIFINPEITKRSKETFWAKGEGCLSVRWIYGTTKRNKSVTVRAVGEDGKTFTMSGTGLLSQIFQHEIDHLDGILFVDHAKDIRHMTDEEVQEYQDEMEMMKRNK